ncbi:hypothetical protein ACFV0R_30170 [Streptomyces sp. NPDC059578]|uniref:hypothetical protein n=1 Tax=Streptomyces sp. NPDC059578 TaxID=3346874 RepID=UPI0036A5BCE6
MDRREASTPGPAGISIVAAGVHWDAVKVSRPFALQSLEHLPVHGAIAVDPTPAGPFLYFLVPPKSTEGWSVPQSTALSETAHVALPPPGRLTPPGPYWLTQPGHRPRLTRTDVLRAALEAVLGPRHP